MKDRLTFLVVLLVLAIPAAAVVNPVEIILGDRSFQANNLELIYSGTSDDPGIDLVDGSGNGRSTFLYAGSTTTNSRVGHINTTDAFEIRAGTNGVQIFSNSVEAARVDNDSTALNTRFLIYDVDNATLERVSVGIADSGGSGFKLLRIVN